MEDATSKAPNGGTKSSAPPTLRIASLLPSTTDICISLGLEERVVGITHECDFPSSSHPLYRSADPLVVSDVGGTGANRNGGGGQDINGNKPLTLTVSQIDPHLQSQSEIDAAVKSSVHDGISLYNLNDTALTDEEPSIILTQSLCEVCAVAKDEVDNEVACNFSPGQCRVLSLEPESLEEVIDTFTTVAEACGIKNRGTEVAKKFREGMDGIAHATSLSKKKAKKPTVLFFEWMDPPFDAGHWIPDMLEKSGCASAVPWSKNTRKSIQLSWEKVYDCDPDVIIIGCCGFDLKRNEADARAAVEKLRPLRAFQEGRVFASDGNLYFARPGPGLREGMAILARCAYDGEDEVIDALEGLQFLPKQNEGWSKIDFDQSSLQPIPVSDIEDLVSYSKLHDEACRAQLDMYIDPKTGYNVYTEYAHLKRGKCCGSGCRHCPYNHANVKDKASRIQQPAFIYEGVDIGEGTLFASVSSIPPDSQVKVLFFSGGKDSFLALRRLVKQRQASDDPFHVILLTTFDVDSREIAHQEIPIDTVVRQAEHLGLPLLGIPLRRGSGETYLGRIEKGLELIRQRVADMQQMTLVFGDLHLDHIREWRDKEMSEYALEYPLWKRPYEELMDDLEESGVRVVVSAVTKGEFKPGMIFSRDLWNDAVKSDMDGFGEEGEFHSIAEVWSVSREQALGLRM